MPDPLTGARRREYFPSKAADARQREVSAAKRPTEPGV
jgi:hypothetical protein